MSKKASSPDTLLTLISILYDDMLESRYYFYYIMRQEIYGYIWTGDRSKCDWEKSIVAHVLLSIKLIKTGEQEKQEER